jgi:hypothetical protein
VGLIRGLTPRWGTAGSSAGVRGGTRGERGNSQGFGEGHRRRQDCFMHQTVLIYKEAAVQN